MEKAGEYAEIGRDPYDVELDTGRWGAEGRAIVIGEKY